VEIVSRINWSQIARLRRCLAVVDQPHMGSPFIQLSQRPRAAFAKTLWGRLRHHAA
jgi:hypothetical protein